MLWNISLSEEQVRMLVYNILIRFVLCALGYLVYSCNYSVIQLSSYTVVRAEHFECVGMVWATTWWW